MLGVRSIRFYRIPYSGDCQFDLKLLNPAVLHPIVSDHRWFSFLMPIFEFMIQITINSGYWEPSFNVFFVRPRTKYASSHYSLPFQCHSTSSTKAEPWRARRQKLRDTETDSRTVRATRLDLSTRLSSQTR